MNNSTESATLVVAKISPPATVSLATFAGYQVSELVLWVTLIYTSLLVVHKVWTMLKEFRE